MHFPKQHYRSKVPQNSVINRFITSDDIDFFSPTYYGCIHYCIHQCVQLNPPSHPPPPPPKKRGNATSIYRRCIVIDAIRNVEGRNITMSSKSYPMSSRGPLYQRYGMYMYLNTHLC